MNPTIYKYPLEISDVSTLTMPSGAKPLKVEMQNGASHLWALVDTDQPDAEYEIRCFGTGQPISLEYCELGAFPRPEYIGTVFDGMFVWHFLLKPLNSVSDIFGVIT